MLDNLASKNKRLFSTTQLTSYVVATQIFTYMAVGYINNPPTNSSQVASNVMGPAPQNSLQSIHPVTYCIHVDGACKNLKGTVGGFISENGKILLSRCVSMLTPALMQVMLKLHLFING